VLDKVEYSAFESTLHSLSYRIVSFVNFKTKIQLEVTFEWYCFLQKKIELVLFGSCTWPLNWHYRWWSWM